MIEKYVCYRSEGKAQNKHVASQVGYCGHLALLSNCQLQSHDELFSHFAAIEAKRQQEKLLTPIRSLEPVLSLPPDGYALFTAEKELRIKI